MNPAGLPCGSFGFSLPKRFSSHLAGLPDLPKGNPAAQRQTWRRFLFSEKPNNPQDEPAGFGIAA